MLKKCVTLHRYLSGAVLALLACCFTACSEDDDVTVQEYDPNTPVTITDFLPKSGGANDRLIIYGENFGNDTSKVKVTVGGVKATLISAKSNVRGNDDGLYVFVPQGAFSGEIQVTVGDETTGTQSATATEKFEYERKMVVGRLCGYRNEYDDQGWNDGPFSTCTGFAADGEMKFDPKYPNLMYIGYDQGSPGIQVVDFDKQTVESIMGYTKFKNINRIRSIDFTSHNGVDYMIVSVDDGSSQQRSPSVYIVRRNEDGTFNENSDTQLLAAYRQCNGAYIHPVSGDLYFNSYENGQFFRLDMDAYFESLDNGSTWDPYLLDYDLQSSDSPFQQLFTIQDVNWEFKIAIHPTGAYAYIIVVNQHYILRTDYDEAKQRFTAPYIVAGQMKAAGWADGVGTAAQLATPYQGVFVKNEDYVAEGKEDVYDFYFAEKGNHDVRKMTPEGIVSTFAGRGSRTSAADNNIWGTDNGDLREVARFRDPTGLAYDESKNMFYVLDTVGRSIRTIGMEEDPNENGESTGETGGSDTEGETGNTTEGDGTTAN